MLSVKDASPQNGRGGEVIGTPATRNLEESER
jgi:hypothetical protein